jgi:branched-chain amino acid transport system ATP-binding protein
MAQIVANEIEESLPISQHLLELKNIDAFYGAAQALDKVSLHVDEGEIVCLLGGNASGKSTTMKIILGLLRPRSGEVLLLGKSTAHLHTPAIIKRGVASVPEARRIFPEMTVEENLRVGAYLRHDSSGIKQDLKRMFDLFPRLAERKRQHAGTLSGGEQQMLAFARALMSRPRLICMDEPTMGLAPIFVERVLDTIAEINRMGVTVFMVEQNAELALSIATRGYILQSGRLVLEGPARDLLNNPAIREAYLGQRASSEEPETSIKPVEEGENS